MRGIRVAGLPTGGAQEADRVTDATLTMFTGVAIRMCAVLTVCQQQPHWCKSQAVSTMSVQWSWYSGCGASHNQSVHSQ